MMLMFSHVLFCGSKDVEGSISEGAFVPQSSFCRSQSFFVVPNCFLIVPNCFLIVPKVFVF